MTIKIVPNEKGNPPGKLADAELHFGDGVLDGLKLIGFSVWERRTGNGRNVTGARARSRTAGLRRVRGAGRRSGEVSGMFRLGDVPSAAALRRPCWRKQAYESQGAAEAHLRSLERSPRVRSPADRLRVYACRHCTHWHVGHAR